MRARKNYSVGYKYTYDTPHAFRTYKHLYALTITYSRTSIIRISRLSGLFPWSQFGHECLLVTIKKIRSHILFKTTALKGAVKCEGFLLSKSKSSAGVCCNQWKTFEWVLVGSKLRCCSVKFHALWHVWHVNKEAGVTIVSASDPCFP